MKLLLATRPYEVNKGSTQELYEKWQQICYKSLNKGNIKEFKKNIIQIVASFKDLPLKKINKPKVGIVGEILIKYHFFGNDNIIAKLENEGAEVFVPELMGFVKYCAYNGIIKSDLMKNKTQTKYVYQIALKIISWYEEIITTTLKDTDYRPPCNIFKLADNVKGILSTGNQTGEGWFLTAEMIELIQDNVPNIVCVQPFACLPNHIVGKAVIKKIRHLYPESNIIAIDYDPGASHTNQVNRLKLMLTVAKENLNHKTKIRK